MGGGGRASAACAGTSTRGPRRRRPPWLADLVAREQTCLIGGVTAQPGAGEPGGGWAYGVARPGQVVAVGTAQVLGSGPAQVCPDCGRSLDVRYGV
jgi:hypothetical protein